MDTDFNVFETEEVNSSDEKLQRQTNSSNLRFVNCSEQWYHGRLSRTLAEDRLKTVNFEGCFLIRESDRRPKTYVLSFLHKIDEVLHFTITAVCGEYFISRFKFQSLVDLVEYFAVYSEISSGQYLLLPVRPPSTVELSSRKVVSIVSFRGMKDTDELSFVKNDIFTVLEDFGDGWIGVRSDRTGETGLVYERLVEDLSSENLDPERLPYFYDKLLTQEAVQMLILAGRGSYLVKRSDSSIGNFTLLLNTGVKIERVLIKLTKRGSYEVGSRNFKCLHDIVERYSQTEICDGFLLTNPLCKPTELPDNNYTLDVELYQKLQLNRFSITKFAPNVTKCGYLYKKSKSDNKWRSMYFILKDIEGQLFCYESEKKTKAKLVLDLCHCTFYEIHRSLFDRPFCFQIVLYGMTKPVSFYFYAEDSWDFEEWSSSLKSLCAGYRRWHSSPFSSYRKLDDYNNDATRLRKIQHLNIRIHEVRNVPSEVSTVSLTFYGRAKRLFRHVELGVAKIDLISDKSKEDTLDFHDWAKLKSSTKDSDCGQCRIYVRFVRQKVMPVEEYSSLYEVLRANDFELCHCLADVCRDDDKHRLAVAMLNVFCVDQLYLQLLNAENCREVNETERGVLLFRKTSFASILMNEFLGRIALDYVRITLTPVFDRILEFKTVLETDQSKVDKYCDISVNALQLIDLAGTICKCIISSGKIFPKLLQYVLYSLKLNVAEKWPNDLSAQLRAVSSFVFLRLICLVLLHPKRYGLTTEILTDANQRNLLFVTKIVQNAANVKERRLNSPTDDDLEKLFIQDAEIETISNFLAEIRPSVALFLEEISSPCSLTDLPASPLSATKFDIAAHFATIFSICEKNFDRVQAEIPSNPAFRNLVPVVELLRSHLNHYLKKDS